MFVILMVVFVVGCNITEEPKAITGSWSMMIESNDEQRIGIIHLNDNGTGFLKFNEAPNSSLLSTAEETNFNWVYNFNTLELTRADNSFKLNYVVRSATINRINLSYLDDIEITLFR